MAARGGGAGCAAYLIDRRRGYEASVKLLGADYAGKMTCDGWAAYRRFCRSTIQTCLGHLIRRCGEMEEVAKGGAVVFPRKVKSILRAGLSARDGPVERRLRVAEQLQQKMEKLIEPVAGAWAQSVLMTVLQTLKLRALEPLQWLSDLLYAPRSVGPILVPHP